MVYKFELRVIFAVICLWLTKPLTVGAVDYNLDFSEPIALPQSGGYDYAYAPSVIKENGNYYAFFCSRPTLQDGYEGWDVIRMTKSNNLKDWSQPKIVVPIRQNMGSDGKYTNLAACDPSLVYRDGYYYIYFLMRERLI